MSGVLRGQVLAREVKNEVIVLAPKTLEWNEAGGYAGSSFAIRIHGTGPFGTTPVE